jgi:hypothetical protein
MWALHPDLCVLSLSRFRGRGRLRMLVTRGCQGHRALQCGSQLTVTPAGAEAFFRARRLLRARASCVAHAIAARFGVCFR